MTTAERHRLLQKRSKLAALAERGVDGEREVAKAKLHEFDHKHPGLGGAQGFTGTISINGKTLTSEQLAKMMMAVMEHLMRRRYNYTRRP